MSEDQFDIVILGAGTGGYSCALRAAQLGMKVAVVEADKVGGTCLHRGCIPTKALLHAAETADTVREADSLGINSSLDSIDMVKVSAYRQGVIDKMHKGLSHTLKARKIEVINGWGRLVSPDTIEVDGRRLTGKNIVLASGSYSKSLPGLELNGRVIASETALQMEYVPSSAIILGGGVIGVEFASVWKSLGAEVTIIEGLPHLVPNEDEAVSKALEKAFKARGIKYQLGTRFSGVTQDASSVHVTTEDGQSYDAEVMLVAVGRGPATQGLGYEEQGIKMDRGFVLTDERLRTGVGNIYALGDIVPGLQLAHRGFMQGIFVAEEIAGLNPSLVEENKIPRVTFCDPEIASVGLTETQAKEKYGADQIVSHSTNLMGNGKSQILGATGFIKLVAVKDGPIVGFHAIGKRLGEQIGEGQLIVNWEAYPEDLAPLIHAHPTQNEAIGEAALALTGKALHG